MLHVGGVGNSAFLTQHTPCPGGGQRGGAPDLAEEDIEELRWEPALKLPTPVAAGDESLAAGSALLPRPLGKQVLHCLAIPLHTKHDEEFRTPSL